ISRQWLGEPYSPLAAHFRHPKPRDTRLHEQIFGCPVSFEQPHDELVFHREALALPLRSTEPALREYLRAIARSRLGELSPVSTMVRDVKDALDAALTRGDLGISLEQVARELSTSARSLQRYLRHQGSTFQQMLDQARQRRAMVLLRQPGMTLSQVSDALGFSEPSALRRALRRWGQEHRASSRMDVLPAQ
ncbi:MAG TPA: AraC family transcriptional regulator ligand-binding domain-containing protein, partial [Archangium sp.]|nr:AraC family transcriptional regulator ligand-binding domain-containing protein [Archangium sp.]